MKQSLLQRANSLSQKSFWELFTVLVEASDVLSEISPRKRRPWLSEVVDDIYRSQDGKCAICGADLEFGSHEVDHIIPFVYGGGNERANLQITCQPCNRKKHKDVDPIELLEYLEDRYMNL